MTTHFDLDDSYAVQEDPCQPAAFEFPDLCSRCLAPSPEKGWKVGNGKQVAAGVLVSFEVTVPVCAACWSKLMKVRMVLGLATAAIMLPVLATLVILDPFGLRSAELQEIAGGYFLIVLFLLTAAIGVYYLLGGIVAPRKLRGVAHLSRDGAKLTFFNPEYQRLFVEPCRSRRDESPGW